MTQQARKEQITHEWYSRPVFFVADVKRALRFYADLLGFEKAWHEGDGKGKVCQVIALGARSSSARIPTAKT